MQFTLSDHLDMLGVTLKRNFGGSQQLRLPKGLAQVQQH